MVTSGQNHLIFSHFGHCNSFLWRKRWKYAFHKSMVSKISQVSRTIHNLALNPFDHVDIRNVWTWAIQLLNSSENIQKAQHMRKLTGANNHMCLQYWSRGNWKRKTNTVKNPDVKYNYKPHYIENRSINVSPSEIRYHWCSLHMFIILLMIAAWQNQSLTGVDNMSYMYGHMYRSKTIKISRETISVCQNHHNEHEVIILQGHLQAGRLN